MDEKRVRNRWGFREGRIQQVMMGLDEHNEVKSGDAYLVRIPKIEGKIRKKEDGNAVYVEYICKSWYDREKKQMRNRKVRIGQCFETFPGAMLPNENYYRYFDRKTWELKKDEGEGGAWNVGDGGMGEI